MLIVPAAASGLLGVVQVAGITIAAVLAVIAAWRGLLHLVHINAAITAQDALDAKDLTIRANQQSIEALETRVSVLEAESTALRDALVLANQQLQDGAAALVQAHEDYRKLEQFAAPQAFIQLERTVGGLSGRIEEVLSQVAAIAKRDFAMRNASILGATSDGIILVSGYSGNIEYANTAAEQIFGYEAGELNDRPLDVLIPERLRVRHRQHRRLFMEDPTVRDRMHRRPLTGLMKDATEIPVEISLSPMDGYRIVAAIRDATPKGRRRDDQESAE